MLSVHLLTASWQFSLPPRIVSSTAASPLANDSSSFLSLSFSSVADCSITSAICLSSVCGNSAAAFSSLSSSCAHSASSAAICASMDPTSCRSLALASPGNDQYQLLVPILSTCTSESSMSDCTTSFTAWNTTPLFAAAFSTSFSSHGLADSWNRCSTVLRLSCTDGRRMRGQPGCESRDAGFRTASNLGTPPAFRSEGGARMSATGDAESGRAPPRTCPWAASRLTYYAFVERARRK